MTVRKLMPLLLVLVLLCGCAQEDPENATAVSASPTVQVAENLTCFGDAPAGQMYDMGSRLLTYDGTAFTVVGTERITLAAEGAEGIQSGDLGAAYYRNGAVTLLNPQLRVNETLTLPAETDSVPVTDVENRCVYYTAGGELRVVSFGDKLPRLLRAYENITLVPRALVGGMLECEITDVLNDTAVYCLSVENGETLSSRADYETVYACGTDYIAMQADGIYTRRIWSRGGTERDLRLPEGYAVLAMTKQGPVLRQGSRLVLIDENGKCIAACTLPCEPEAAVGGSYLWVRGTDGKLYRWAMETQEAADFGVTLRQIYTAENPDTAGLNALKARAKELKSKYKCNILLNDTAVSRTGGHTLVREYQVDTVKQVMDALEAALPDAQLPKNYSICIVRSVDGKTEPVEFKQGRFTFLLLPAGCDVAAALK